MQRLLISLIFCLAVQSAQTALGGEPYKLPPADVVRILDAPRTPVASVSPTGEQMLLANYEPMPAIGYLAKPVLRLAGIRVTPWNNGSQRTFFCTAFEIMDLETKSTLQTGLPHSSRFGFPEWSGDGRRLAFLRHVDAGVELWIADTRTGKAKVLTGPRVNTTLGRGFAWMPDNKQILVTTVPERRTPPPQPPLAPGGPNVQETEGKFSKVRTYQDLLSSPYDEELFDYYMTSQVALIDVQRGKKRNIGRPGIFSEISPSPDGRFLLVRRILKPYSYSVPYYYFAQSIEVWNTKGEVVHRLAQVPVAEEVPIMGVRTGPRGIEWRPLEPATLVWVEALDGGDPETEVPNRDRLMTLSQPFLDGPAELRRMEHRLWDIRWLELEGLALISERDWKRRWRTTYLARVDDPQTADKKVFDLSVHDAYNDPGSPVSRRTVFGEDVLLQDGDWVYFSGRGGSPEGDRPFLDRLNLKTLAKERLFQSSETSYEVFYDFVGDSRVKIVTRNESKEEPPNFYIVDTETKERQALTQLDNPTPELAGITSEIVRYARADGVELSGRLYLPSGYTQGKRLPLVIWAYPEEYSDPDVAGQVRGSANRFLSLRGSSELFFVTQGYAVLDDAQMPVVGDPKTMNETFVEQVVASARAAIEKLDSMGIADPRRVGIGGHSYGAFMAANLLAHSDLFAAGIARSGAYNRTLTPFGFQSERRTLWEARETYMKLSPFVFANQINEPILLIHGEVDSNSGTYPMQSERLFHALKGHGATARLVMLPHEDHGYVARESILHVLAEMIEWFDRHVKERE